MKKIIIILPLIGASLFFSCSKEVCDPCFTEKGYVTAETPIQSDSKTSLTRIDDINKIVWNAGDKIDVIGKSEEQKRSHIYTLCSGAGTSAGTFGSSDPCTDETVVFAAYPEGEWIKPSYYYLTVPFEQQYCSTGVQDGIIPMYAQGNPSGLVFNHIAAIFKVKAYNASGVTISRVELSCTENIAGIGGVVFSMSTTAPSRVANYGGSIRSSRGKNKISLLCDNVELGRSSSAATEFNFVVFAKDVVNGYKISDLTFTFYEANSARSFVISKSTDETYYAGKIYNFPTVNCTPSNNGIKVFIDDVEGDWDNIATPSTSVRVVSTSQKLTNEMLSSILNAINLSSSDEITLDLSESEYNETVWADEVKECQKISVLKLPANIISLPSSGGGCFNTHFSEIHFPAATNSINSNQIGACGAKIIIDPQNATYSNNEEGWLLSKDGKKLCCIANARYYQSLTIPEGITELGGYFYQDSYNMLTKIVLPSTLQTIVREAFVNQYELCTIDCRSLNSVPSWACGGTITPIGKNAKSTRRIVVKDSLLESFQNAGSEDGWQLILSKFETNPWTYVPEGSYQEEPGAILQSLPRNTEYDYSSFWK